MQNGTSRPTARVAYCANCEAPLGRSPVAANGVLFCCTGCAEGGPCMCTEPVESWETIIETLASEGDGGEEAPSPAEPAPLPPAPRAEKLPLRVVISARNPLLREALAQLLAGSAGVDLAGSFADARSALEAITWEGPSVLLMYAEGEQPTTAPRPARRDVITAVVRGDDEGPAPRGFDVEYSLTSSREPLAEVLRQAVAAVVGGSARSVDPSPRPSVDKAPAPSVTDPAPAVTAAPPLASHQPPTPPRLMFVMVIPVRGRSEGRRLCAFLEGLISVSRVSLGDVRHGVAALVVELSSLEGFLEEITARCDVDVAVTRAMRSFLSLELQRWPGHERPSERRGRAGERPGTFRSARLALPGARWKARPAAPARPAASSGQAARAEPPPVPAARSTPEAVPTPPAPPAPSTPPASSIDYVHASAEELIRHLDLRLEAVMREARARVGQVPPASSPARAERPAEPATARRGAPEAPGGAVHGAQGRPTGLRPSARPLGGAGLGARAAALAAGSWSDAPLPPEAHPAPTLQPAQFPAEPGGQVFGDPFGTRRGGGDTGAPSSHRGLLPDPAPLATGAFGRPGAGPESPAPPATGAFAGFTPPGAAAWPVAAPSPPAPPRPAPQATGAFGAFGSPPAATTSPQPTPQPPQPATRVAVAAVADPGAATAVHPSATAAVAQAAPAAAPTPPALATNPWHSTPQGPTTGPAAGVAPSPVPAAQPATAVPHVAATSRPNAPATTGAVPESPVPARPTPPPAPSRTSLQLQQFLAERREEDPGLTTVPTDTTTAAVRYELYAYPFASFGALASFQTALRKLTGVRSVRTREFTKGTLRLWIEYDNPIPLAQRLAGLEQFQPKVVREDGNVLEIVVEPQAGAGAVDAGRRR